MTTTPHTRIEFDVYGTPIAQGSKKMVGPWRMIETAKGHADWRQQVAVRAREAHQQHPCIGPDPLDGPLRLSCVFRFPMPASRKKAVRDAGQGPKSTAPDLDKLIRCVGDALTAAGVIRDDARIVSFGRMEKIETTGWTGASIRVETVQ